MKSLLKPFIKTIQFWYVPLIFGVVFILCGLYVFSCPLETYLALSFLFSLSFIISGLGDLIFSMRNSNALKGWGWYLISGLISFMMGVYLLSYPGISASILVFVVGFTIMFRSFQLFGFALDLRDAAVVNWGNTALMSALGIIFSFLLLANPIFSGLSIVVLTGLSFLSTGVASIILSFHFKKIKRYAERISDPLKRKIEALQKELDDEIGTK